VMHFGHAANTALYRNLRYDAVRDFEPIGLIAESPMALVAKKNFPADNLRDFIAYVKANNTQVTHGHAGIGSASHLCGLLFFNAIATTVTSIPYKGTGPALNDLIGRQFDFMCDQTLNVLQPVNAGLIKAFATTTKARLAVAPDLPTAAEAGLPGVEITVWFGMWAPKATPQPVIEKLSAGLREALNRARGEEPPRHGGRRDGGGGARDASGLARASQIGNRQVGADYSEGRHLRGIDTRSSSPGRREAPRPGDPSSSER